MPEIINPIPFEPPPTLVNFDGSTALEVDATLSKGLGVHFTGSTALEVALSAELAGAVNFTGATALQVTGRLNDEVNVFGEVNFAGATVLEVDSEAALATGAVNFTGATALEVTATVERAETPSFSFIVNVHNAAASAAYANNVRRFSARLLVNGSAVPIKSATLNAPPDTLGTELSVELARADASQIPLDAVITFQLGIWTGAAFAYDNLLTGGKLSARSKRIVNNGNLPVDTVNVSFVDIIGDRWNLAPSANVVLFDPDKVQRQEQAPTRGGSTSYLRLLDGTPVETSEESVPDLDLYEVLRRAYVVGCGFDSVKTNVPNFPVEEVAFTLSGGYDAGVRPLLTPFAPVVFAVGAVLWIVDADAPVPAGLSLTPLAVNRLVEITSTLPNREPVDGLIVKLKVDELAGEYFTERLETDPAVESGIFGSEGYTVTNVERRVREFRTVDNPGVIRREEVASLKTTVEDFEFNVVTRETLTEQLDGLNRKVGHRRSVEQRLPVPETGELELQEASRETQTITYGAHPLKPKLDTILRVETQIDGLILVDPDNQYLEKDYKAPLSEAHRAGLVEKESSQTVEFGALKTILETLTVRGETVQMETRTINHVAGIPDTNRVTTRAGAAEIERKSQAEQTILLTLEGVVQKRRVAEFDGTGLPSATALDLADRYLRRLHSPPLDFAGVLAFPDRSLRRGSLLAISERSGVPLGSYIATGYKLDFNRTDAGALEITGSLTARQLTNQP
jgi:hypothetical protein